MLNIGVLVSGGGTNLQAILDAEKSGIIESGRVTCVISSNPSAYALKRAQNSGIKTVVVNRRSYTEGREFDKAILQALTENHIDMVVLAGFMCILGERIIKSYENKILNVHPSLIPSFCGEGFYGLRVHEKALEYGVKVTGATVHFVSEVVDGGKIILQKAVEIADGDTPEVLQKRVMEQAEWIILPKAVELVAKELLNI